jgi:acyl-CoA synthetase (NDP forming)
VLESPDVDAVVASLVPLTPAMLTTPDEIGKSGSLVERLPRLFAATDKPLVVSVDCGERYDAFARAIRAAGVPVFRSADEAVRSLGRYLCRRSPVIAARDAANSADAPALGPMVVDDQSARRVPAASA